MSRHQLVDGVGREGCRHRDRRHAHPAGVVGDVVDVVGNRTSEFGNDEVMHADFFRPTLSAAIGLAFLKSPTSSFFLVSTEIAGSPAASVPFTRIVDVVELRIAIRMVRALSRLADWIANRNQACGAARPPGCGRSCGPSHVQLVAELAQALAGPQSGDCGSPRVVGSTRQRKSSMRLASVSLNGLRPPPGRRTRSASSFFASGATRPARARDGAASQASSRATPR